MGIVTLDGSDAAGCVGSAWEAESPVGGAGEGRLGIRDPVGLPRRLPLDLDDLDRPG